MLKKLKKVLVMISTFAIITSSTSFSYAENKFSWGNIIQDKIVGNNRFDTAVKISQLGWYSSDRAVLVNSTSTADALCASPYAQVIEAPILYSNKGDVPKSTIDELKRLKVKEVVLIGGEAVLENKIIDQLVKSGFNGLKVKRLHGKDRYATSIDISKEYIRELELANNHDNSEYYLSLKGVAIVNGYKGLTDALSISAYASKRDMPIIYSDGKDLNIKEHVHNLNREGAKEIILLGNEDKISKEIENHIKNSQLTWGPHEVKRISGNNEKEVNANVLKTFHNDRIIPNLFVVKDGMIKESDLVDGLAVGALAGRMEVPILIASDNLSSLQKEYISSSNIVRVTQVGGGRNEKVFNEIVSIQNSKPLAKEPKYDNMKIPTIQPAKTSKIKIYGSHGAPVGGNNIYLGEIQGDLYAKYGDPKLGAHHYGVNNQMQYDKVMAWVNRIIATTEFRTSSQWVYLQHYINSNDTLPDNFVDPVLASKGYTANYGGWKKWNKYLITGLEKKIITTQDAENLMIHSTVLSASYDGRCKMYDKEDGHPHSPYDGIYRGMSDCDVSAQTESAVADALGFSSFVGGTVNHVEAYVLIGNYWWRSGTPTIGIKENPFKKYSSILSAPTYNLEHLYNKSKLVQDENSNGELHIDFK